MPPAAVPRQIHSSDASGHKYAAVFGVIGAAVIIGGVLWGYILPKWNAKHRKPVQTRYSCIECRAKHGTQSTSDLQLPLMFPPHPAVVVPLNKKRVSELQYVAKDVESMPVYDPRTRSPFPISPTEGALVPQKHADVGNESMTALTRKPNNLHFARLPQTHCKKPVDATQGNAFRQPSCSSGKAAQGGCRHRDGADSTRAVVFEARPAGAPPLKPQLARLAKLASQKPPFEIPARRAHSSFTKMPSKGASGAGPRAEQARCQCRLAQYSQNDGDTQRQLAREVTPRSMKEMKWSVDKATPMVHNVSETASSPETAITTTFDSSPNQTHHQSTPLTGPDSSALSGTPPDALYPGVVKLLPTRRLRKSYAITDSKRTAHTDAVSEAGCCQTSNDLRGPGNLLIVGHRPASAPPASSTLPRIDGRVLDDSSAVQYRYVGRLRLRHSLSSSNSRIDSLALFPRPLTVRRTITSKSQLITPTPAGRHEHVLRSSRDLVRCKPSDFRPAARRRTFYSKHRMRASSAFCVPSRMSMEPNSATNSAYPNLDGNSFTHQLGLGRFGSRKHRSSTTSLSTLRIPRSFRPSKPRAASSLYSRDTKGLSVVPSPGLVSEFPSSTQLLPDTRSVRRAASCDEADFEDLARTPVLGQDGDSGSSYARSEVGSSDAADHSHEETVSLDPTPPYAGAACQPQVSESPNKTSSSSTGTQLATPAINIARTSDDVFGVDDTAASGGETVVVEAGRVFHRVRAMESKISHEDLAKYGGQTAPGGVEWF